MQQQEPRQGRNDYNTEVALVCVLTLHALPCSRACFPAGSDLQLTKLKQLNFLRFLLLLMLGSVRFLSSVGVLKERSIAILLN